MAKAKKRQKTEADIQSEAALEVVNADKAVEQRAESEKDANNLDFRSAGAIDALRMMSSHTQMLMWVTLYRVKKRKEYKTHGATWEQFCDEVIGIPKRTADQKLLDIRPVIEQYEADLNNLVGFTHSQIKLIGRAVGDGDAQMDGDEIVYNGERYPLKPGAENDILALINALKEELSKREQEADEKVSDMESRLKAKDALAKKAREEAADLKEQLERRDLDARAEEFENADEQTKCGRVEKALHDFKGIMIELRPENKKLLKDATPRLKAEYLAALYEMREKIMTAYDGAVEKFGTPAAHGAFDQEKGVNLDDVPDPVDQDGVDPENVIAIQKKAK
jgi:hypothetical protein